MPTSIIILALERRSDPNLLAYGGAVVSGMRDNKAFPLPGTDTTPSGVQFDGYFVTYRDAYNAALTHDTQKINLRNEARQVFCDALKRVAAYVEFTANGNMALLATTGFELRHASSRTVNTDLPGPVADLRGESTEHSGRIDMHASKADGAMGYEVQTISTDPTSAASPAWLHAHTVFAVQRFSIDGLTPGYVWVRMRAVNSNGYGPWCSPVRVLVM
jgi:hypothetical protein